MATPTLYTLSQDVLMVRTQLRAHPRPITVNEILQLETLKRSLELLRQDLIASDVEAGYDMESIGVKHALSASRISQIYNASKRLTKNSSLKPRQPYHSPVPYGARRR